MTGKLVGLHSTVPSKPGVVDSFWTLVAQLQQAHQPAWGVGSSTPRKHGLGVVVPLLSLAEGMWF